MQSNDFIKENMKQIKKEHVLMALFLVIIPISTLLLSKNTNSEISNTTISFGNSQREIKSWNIEEMKVFFISEKNLPMIDVKIVLDAGSVRDSKYGLANMTASLLSEGTTIRSNHEISKEFDKIGAFFGSSASKDSTEVSLRTLSEKKEDAFKLFLEVLGKPSFTEESFGQVKSQLLTYISHSEQNPAFLAQREIYSNLYGSHPYNHLTEGTKESINTIEIKDIKEFYNKYYSSSNSVLTIIGDIELSDAKDFAHMVYKNLPSHEASANIPSVEQNGHVEKWVKHDSQQSHILMGQLAYNVNDKSQFAFAVGNNILGSGQDSILFKELRDNNGLAYSVYSYFQPLLEKGPFFVNMQTKNENLKKSINMLKEQLSKFIQNGPSEEEISEAKQSLIGSFPLSFSSNKQLLNLISYLAFYNIPLEYLSEYTENIKNVSSDDIKDAYSRLSLDEMVTVIVGPANG